MKILAISYDKDFNEETIEFWYQHFKEINKDIFRKAIQKVITTKKFMPSIAELLDICNQEQNILKVSVLEEMNKYGYFKNPNEYEKASRWIEKGITPEWLLKDMQQRLYKTISKRKKANRRVIWII